MIHVQSVENLEVSQLSNPDSKEQRSHRWEVRANRFEAQQLHSSRGHANKILAAPVDSSSQTVTKSQQTMGFHYDGNQTDIQSLRSLLRL